MQLNSRKYLVVLGHICGWLIFISLPILALPRPRFIPEDMETSTLLFVITLGTIPLMVAFYLHLHVLLPRLYLKRRYWQYALAVLLTLLAIQVLTLLWYLMSDQTKLVFHGTSTFLHRATAYRSVVALLVSFGIFSYQRWQDAERERTASELAYLKAQINPHFLFNSLNSIYYLALQRSERTAVAVEKLSGIMRYVITEAASGLVPLEREAHHIGDYIALQRLRLSAHVQVTYEVQGDLTGKSIAPLLLISFVENAFKHGISMEQDSPIEVLLATQGSQMQFSVRNRKLSGYHGQSEESGIGLGNTRRRLNLTYPGRHQLEIQQTDTEFYVLLKIQLA
jgi:LytS/YehU family sensor histidine kinase